MGIMKIGASNQNGVELLKRCQEWFEAIDFEASGYSSLEEAMNDIYQDFGETAELYQDIVSFLRVGK